MVVLYRSGKLEHSAAENIAPAVASAFDNVAELLGLPPVRANSVFFNASFADSMHWSSQRYNEGLDANIYSVEIENEPVYAYNIRSYNLWAAAYATSRDLAEKGEIEYAEAALRNGVKFVKEYYDSRVQIDSEQIPNTGQYEVLVHKELAKNIAEWRTEYTVQPL